MRAFLVIAAFAGASIALASEHKKRDPNKSFTLSVSEKPRARNYVRDWAAAHKKWGKGVPESAISAFSLKIDDGRVDVDPLNNDDLYVAEMEIGNPPQTVKIAIDTASSDFWTQSSDTKYYYNQDGPWAPRYEPNESDTSERVDGAKWEVSYVDGTAARGIVYHDTLRMGEFTFENITVQSAEAIAQRFENETGLSGIMGLAKRLPNSITPSSPSILDQIRPYLAEPVITVDIRRNATGRFDFGYLEDSLATDNFTWMESNADSPHWDIEFGLYAFDGSRERTWYKYPFNATVDTGTTLLFLPDPLASMYWFTIPGMRVDPRLSNSFSFPCAFADSLPNLHLKIPGTQHTLTIPGPYLNYGEVEGEDQEGYCWGGMQSAQGMEVTILGDIMVKAVLLAFDIDGNRVGWANKDLDDLADD